MNLLLLEPQDLGDDGSVSLSDARAHHIRTVLRASPGHTLRVGVLDGPHGSGRVVDVDERTVRLHCAFEAAVPERPRVDLLLAVPRPKVLRRLWPQLAALGVGRIMLTNAERVERNYFDTHVLNPGIYRPLLIEGLQQARDTRLPVVSIHRRFRVLVEDELDGLCSDSARLVADPDATRGVTDAVRASTGGRLLLAVGPEGGWNRFELDMLRAHRFIPAGMGLRTLRSDTACVALLALAHDAARRP